MLPHPLTAKLSASCKACGPAPPGRPRSTPGAERSGPGLACCLAAPALVGSLWRLALSTVSSLLRLGGPSCLGRCFFSSDVEYVTTGLPNPRACREEEGYPAPTPMAAMLDRK
ncbi:hypothetical protein NDU88_005132 [Pleurodeles waltl]|uniref:Uncharacterized protein n=1 Tax=Pleurodeles waltl TaxID=8319 RepID=A0AAV7M9M9_PLEWA|nr:hypothetical protein NDU88_005132 [Pleurodeles waltl]